MSRTVARLKELALKCTSASTVAAVEGNTVDEVISYIEANFNVNGADGENGVSVTAIALETTGGAVTAGTVTFSDSTTAAITITTSGT